MGKAPDFLVIPAAGLGVRMGNVDPDLPKEMLPVGKKPAIQYAVIEGLSAGIENIVIIINRRKEIIRRFFEDSGFRASIYPQTVREMDEVDRTCSIHFLYQEQPTGEWDAINLSRSRVGNSSLAIFFPDNIYLPAPGALAVLKASFEHYDKDVVALTRIEEKSARTLGNSGRVDLLSLSDDVFKIERFHPKGKGFFVPRYPEELRRCGISIFGPHLFDYIDRARWSLKEGDEFTDVSVGSLILQEREMLGCRLPGSLYDIGNPEGYDLCCSHINEAPL